MKSVVSFFAILFAMASCKQTGTDTIYEIKELISPAADSSAEPSLFTDKNGIVYLSWIEKNNGQSILKFSALVQDSWTIPVSISEGNNWFVNWADYPILAADGNSNLMASYLEKSDTAKFTYDVKYVTSSDTGMTWGLPKTLHDDGILAEHGFVSIMPFGEKFFASWLDGRHTAGEESGSHKDHHVEMSIRGAVLSKDGVKDAEWELDSRVCDCCQTSVAITENGPVVVYRDRSEEEVRDMSIVRFVEGKWTAPKTIYPDAWKISGCPVNGPRADAIGNNLAIAWFTMKEDKGKVQVVFSKDGGNRFETPVQIDEGHPIGRVDLVMLDERSAMISWMEGADIKVIKVNADGTTGKPLVVATSSDARASGFPQMTRAVNKIVFAWTDSKSKTIKLASMLL